MRKKKEKNECQYEFDYDPIAELDHVCKYRQDLMLLHNGTVHISFRHIDQLAPDGRCCSYCKLTNGEFEKVIFLCTVFSLYNLKFKYEKKNKKYITKNIKLIIVLKSSIWRFPTFTRTAPRVNSLTRDTYVYHPQYSYKLTWQKLRIVLNNRSHTIKIDNENGS